MPPERMSETNGVNKASYSNRNSILRRRLANKMLQIRNPELAKKLSDLRFTLAPVLNVGDSTPAPDFPRTRLALFCLTENQLDNMAQFYSQVTPSAETNQYHYAMDWSNPLLSNEPELPDDCKFTNWERYLIKLRMFAHFIGMPGTDAPTWQYERQVEILGNRIRRDLRNERANLSKFNPGEF